MYYIAGLGNPGLKYKRTRHNAGFQTIEILEKRHHIKLKATKFDALAGQGMIGNEKVMLIKPTTFMNNSGYAVDGILTSRLGRFVSAKKAARARITECVRL